MHVEFYVDTASEHRWRAIAGNGEIIATSAEGYQNLPDCEDGLALLAVGLRTAAKVVHVDSEGGQAFGNLHALLSQYAARRGRQEDRDEVERERRAGRVGQGSSQGGNS